MERLHYFYRKYFCRSSHRFKIMTDFVTEYWLVGWCFNGIILDNVDFTNFYLSTNYIWQDWTLVKLFFIMNFVRCLIFQLSSFQKLQSLIKTFTTINERGNKILSGDVKNILLILLTEMKDKKVYTTTMSHTSLIRLSLNITPCGDKRICVETRLLCYFSETI